MISLAPRQRSPINVCGDGAQLPLSWTGRSERREGSGVVCPGCTYKPNFPAAPGCKALLWQLL